jgi:hypothetical protein
MLKYTENNEDEEYVYSLANGQEGLDAACLSEADAIEDYLDQVCAPLVGKVARAKREEIRERVRLRLEQFAAAHRELGSTDSEAVDLALAQCGEPELISRRWLPEQQIAQANALTTGRKSQNLSDRLFGSAKASTAVASLTFGLPFIAYLAQASAHIGSTVESDFMYNRVWLLAVPLLAGTLTGLAANKRPARGVVNALMLITTAAIITPAVAFCMEATKIGPDLLQSSASPMIAVVCGFVPWMLLGCTGAGLGQRIRSEGARLTTRVGRVLRTSRGAR